MIPYFDRICISGFIRISVVGFYDVTGVSMSSLVGSVLLAWLSGVVVRQFISLEMFSVMSWSFEINALATVMGSVEGRVMKVHSSEIGSGMIFLNSKWDLLHFTDLKSWFFKRVVMRGALAWISLMVVGIIWMAVGAADNPERAMSFCSFCCQEPPMSWGT